MKKPGWIKSQAPRTPTAGCLQTKTWHEQLVIKIITSLMNSVGVLKIIRLD